MMFEELFMAEWIAAEVYWKRGSLERKESNV